MAKSDGLHPDVAKLQTAWGLPAEPLRDRRLLYAADSMHVVLSFSLLRSGIPHGRLYVRQISEKRYHPVIVDAGEDLSLTCPLLGQGPTLYFLTTRWLSNGSGITFGLARVDIESGHHEVWDTDVPGAERCFVTELVGLSGTQTGTDVYAVVGFRPDAGRTVVDHELVRLRWDSKQIDRLGRLDAIFF